MNLKVPGAILPLGCAFFSTRTKTVWWVVATPPLRRTRVKYELNMASAIVNIGVTIILPSITTLVIIDACMMGKMGILLILSK